MVSKERHGPWAVILGGSEGIGESLATQLAGMGIHLVLVARKADLLEQVAGRIRADSGVEVRTLAQDMSHEDSFEKIVELTDGLEVGLFIHNVAGTGAFGQFFDRSIRSNMGAIWVNVINLTKLVHHFGKPMKERGRGGLVTFGSMAGNIGSPNLATYSGAKAYSQFLFESIWGELRGSGDDVVDVIVGTADTPARIRAGMTDNPEFPPAKPVDIATQTLREIGNGPVLIPAGSEPGFAASATTDRRQAVSHIADVLLSMKIGS